MCDFEAINALLDESLTELEKLASEFYSMVTGPLVAEARACPQSIPQPSQHAEAEQPRKPMIKPIVWSSHTGAA